MTGQLWLIGSGIALARLLGTTNRGYLALLLLWPAVLEQLGAAGLPFAAAYYIARNPADTRSIARLARGWWVKQSTYLVLIQCVILTAYFSSRASYLQVAAAISLATIPSMLAVDYSLAILQGQHRFLAFNVIRNLLPATACIASLVAMLGDINHLPSVILLLMTAYIISGVAAVLFTWRTVRVLPQTTLSTTVASIRSFGRSAFVGSTYPFETFRLDQLVVGILFPAGALGLYVVAQAFTNVPRFVSQSLGAVAYPYVARMNTPQKQGKTILRFTLVAAVLALGTVIVLEVAVGWLIPMLFGVQFADSVFVAQILLVGALFLSLRRILAEGLKGAGYAWIGTAAEVATWVVMLPLAALLIPMTGLVGVAYAVDGAAFISFAFLVYLDWRGPRLALGTKPSFEDGTGQARPEDNHL